MIRVTKVVERKAVTFKGNTFDPSTVDVRDTQNGLKYRTFQGVGNAENFLVKNGFHKIAESVWAASKDKAIVRIMVKQELTDKNVQFSTKDSTKRLLQKLLKAS